MAGSDRDITQEGDGFAFLRRALEDPCWGWSLGVFGAIAEFLRDKDEPAEQRNADSLIEASTARGAIRILDIRDTNLVAYELPSRHEARRRRSFIACLPAARAAMAGRAELTEIGMDAQAIRTEDRAAVLFDLGLGFPNLDACIRTNDAALIAELRAACGRSLFAPGNSIGMTIALASPHRVFMSALGRIEVFQPIPPPDGRSPEGPHTHLLPKLLAHRRTHAATVPVPDGFLPCLGLHPPQAGETCGRA